jgi:putative ABC transport system ATP-binding protein
VEVASLYREPPKEEARAQAALEFIDVFKIYRSGPAETVALRGLDLRIEPGEFVAVLGPSGSGKSTFLNLAAGLDEPSAGEVRVFGRPLNRMDERELAEFRGKNIAIVFQQDNLWTWLTARENVATALRLGGVRRVGETASEALAAVGLAERATHRPRALSGGEQQRAAIAAAVGRPSTLLLADEPTGELDVANEDRVIEDLRRMNGAGTTVITVTHSDRIASEADRVIQLRDGRAA